MLKANSNEFADYRGDNHSDRFQNHHHLSQEDLENQAKIETKEKIEADIELDRKLANLDSIFGNEVTKESVASGIKGHKDKEESFSLEEQVKLFNDKLRKEGKSISEILSTLIEKYENEEAVSTWVQNWRNFQELHEFAITKPPQERRAIERIMTNSDFTSESAFSESLDEIALSKEISKETKKEIAIKFGRGEVTSVKQMDSRLKKLKTEKKRVNKRLKDETKNLYKLSSEIKTLEKNLSDSSISESEREELESQKERLSKEIKSRKKLVSDLEKKKQEEISFPLRENFELSATEKGKRFIRSLKGGVNVQLPSNRLPFSDKRNLDSVNCSFLLESLKSKGLMEHLIKPKFKSGNVPSRELRLFSTRIIEALGLNSSVILSQEDIDILNKDLLSLAKVYPSMTPLENLKMLKIIDNEKGINNHRIFEILNLLKENRDTESSLKSERLRNF